MEPKLKIEYMNTDKLIPYAGNAKEHPEWQVEQIAQSIRQFGFNDPVGVWTRPDGRPEIVEGHGRVLAAKELGIERLPVVRLDHLDDEGRRAYTHIHNQTNLTTGFDWEALDAEIAEMSEIDWSAFGFDVNGEHEWFSDKSRFESSKEEDNDEYNAFVEKFEPKRTTDDCYTPDEVYDAVADWVASEYEVKRSRFVRPFYPGGDYENENYPNGCVVVDNPPFSILAKIVRFYMLRGIRFFIFSPTLTLFSGYLDGACYVAAGCDIVYANGAKVNTSFITNLQSDTSVRTAPSLTAVVAKAVKSISKTGEELPRYEYPKNVITAAMVAGWSKSGVDFAVSSKSSTLIRALDAQKQCGKTIFGSGFLLSDTAAEKAIEAAKAEKAAKAAEVAKAANIPLADIDEFGRVIWRLSERELEIIRSLD